jgi:hypothetical protein
VQLTFQEDLYQRKQVSRYSIYMGKIILATVYNNQAQGALITRWKLEYIQHEWPPRRQSPISFHSTKGPYCLSIIHNNSDLRAMFPLNSKFPICPSSSLFKWSIRLYYIKSYIDIFYAYIYMCSINAAIHRLLFASAAYYVTFKFFCCWQTSWQVARSRPKYVWLVFIHLYLK